MTPLLNLISFSLGRTSKVASVKNHQEQEASQKQADQLFGSDHDYDMKTLIIAMYADTNSDIR